MIVKAHFTAVNHGTFSEYEMTQHGTEQYGVLTPDGWMCFDDVADAREYAALLED